MRWKETRSGKYEDDADSFRRMTKIRQFANCVVFAAVSVEEALVLLIMEPWRGTMTICEYESYAERAEDIEFLDTLPPGGAADAGVALRPLKPPPVRQGGSARPFPPGPEDR